jgi:predicted DNA-binding transcriptional regulator YafY
VRAERLVAIVLLLQTHRQLSAGDLAERLEVSERTIRRDLDSLCYAGLPLYSQRGRGGGWALLDGHKINLSGMTASEAQALLLVAGPQALAELGVEEGVRSALRKLLAALPEPTRERALQAQAAVHVDPANWGREPEPAPLLSALRDAVVNGFEIELTYTKPASGPSKRVIHPYGLVAKNGVWYLVAGGESGVRTFRVSRVSDVEVTGRKVDKPVGFDLEATWEAVTRRMTEQMPALEVEFTVHPGAARWVEMSMAWWIGVEKLDAGDDKVRYRGSFTSAAAAAGELARFGNQVTVESPSEVKYELARLGRALVAANDSDRV